MKLRTAASVVLMIGGACALMVACGTDAGLCDNNRCVGQDGGDDGALGDGMLGDGANIGDGSNQADGQAPVDGSTIDAPPGCDLTKDPKDSVPCVADAVGVFVDATGGLDTNDGSKGKPFQTIAKAVASAGAKPRVYVCAGSYADNVVLDATHAPSVYGGFACSAWTYATSNAVTVKPATGYALEVASVTGGVTVADVELDAPDGSAASVNSIAAFVRDAPKVTIKRGKLVAGTGYQGTDQAQGAAGALKTATPVAGTQTGNASVAATGGPAQTCTCVNGLTSVGGKGGDVGADGASGATAQATAIPNDGFHDGKGGSGTKSCGAGSSDVDGSGTPNQTPAAAIASPGALGASGWASSSGNAGGEGQAGQGGGGGGGFGGGGGGGGCGGCGGSKGLGGGGGGASAALVTFNAPVALLASTLSGGAAGRGGAGAAGGAAQAGFGNHGTSATACNGGNGGLGGNGGAGSGGAGGVGAAVIYKGTKPVYGGDSTLIAGAKGSAGTGGAPGTNDGPDGVGTDAYPAP